MTDVISKDNRKSKPDGISVLPIFTHVFFPRQNKIAGNKPEAASINDLCGG